MIYDIRPDVVQDERGTDDARHSREQAAPQTKDPSLLVDGSKAG